MLVKVRVATDAKKESLEQTAKGGFTISVKEPAERNLANRRVIELVAQHYYVPAKAVRLVSGHHSPSKTLSLPDRLMHP